MKQNAVQSPAKTFFTQVGEVSRLSIETLRRIFSLRWEKDILIQQLEFVGVRSLPVVALTAALPWRQK